VAGSGGRFEAGRCLFGAGRFLLGYALRDVLAKKLEYTRSTSPPPHFGQLTLVVSRSVRDMFFSNRSPHALQVKTYVGIDDLRWRVGIEATRVSRAGQRPCAFDPLDSKIGRVLVLGKGGG
jgi:hypothetical protein